MKNTIKLIPAALLALTMSAHADVSIIIKEVGDDIVITGSGSLINAGVSCFEPLSANAPAVHKDDIANSLFYPFAPLLIIGGESIYNQCEIIDPVKTGTPLTALNNIAQGMTVSGDPFVMGTQPEFDNLWLSFPDDNESPLEVNFSASFPDQSFESLGLIEGNSLTWTWSTEQVGNSAKAAGTQSLTISVGGASVPPMAATPVPALGTFGLMGLAGVVGAAGFAMNRRRKQ